MAQPAKNVGDNRRDNLRGNPPLIAARSPNGYRIDPLAHVVGSVTHDGAAAHVDDPVVNLRALPTSADDLCHLATQGLGTGPNG